MPIPSSRPEAGRLQDPTLANGRLPVSPSTARRLRALGKGGGRPSTFTWEWAERFLAIVRAGNFRSTAARRTGKSPRLARHWLAMGRLSGQEPYATFVTRVELAEAEFEALAVRVVTQAARLDARIALRYLALRHPSRYAERTHASA